MRKLGRVRQQRNLWSEQDPRTLRLGGRLALAAAVCLVGSVSAHHGHAADLEETAADLGEIESRPAVPRSTEVDEGRARDSEPVLSSDLGHEVRSEHHREEEAGAPTEAGTDATAGPEILEDALPGSSSEKTGASSQAIQVPKGAGTIEGMGESFSMQLSTGVGTFSIPIAIPAARGGAQPSLSLSYSSSSGWGIAGMGWDIGVPFIARQTDRGIPGYDDRSDFHIGQDRFVFNGGQELVPICTVMEASRTCEGALPTEEMPVWSTGSQYFRARVEGSFLRFFWSGDHSTWRVQDKSGVTMELGVPLDGSGYRGGLETNPANPSEIYRWNLVRQYDTQGDANPASGNPQPLNVVVYRYLEDGSARYLSDIYDTTPRTAALSTDPAAFAHHTRLVYEERPDPTTSYKSGWLIERRKRLSRVDITSKTEKYGTTRNRQLVRRYHLEYQDGAPVSLLASVTLEGRCSVDEDAGLLELGDGSLGASNCPRLPPMTFGYTPYAIGGSVQEMTASPPHSVDEDLTDLFDVNSDGLPDVLVTAPGTYGSGHAAFFNSPNGVANSFGGATRIGVRGVNGATASTIRLSNSNVAPLDLDGDATIDLLHMPVSKRYSVYTPRHSGGEWEWVGRSVDTSDGLSPKIDLGRDAFETRVLDVNFDGLIDVVRTTGTEIQTFLALGRYPAGNGRFGTGKFTGPRSAQLSTEPIRTCVPWRGTPVRFGDREIQLADMNGDGLQDIVRLQRGAVRYWPGRGNGFWGTGDRSDCKAGTFGQDRHVLMDSSPQFSDLSGASLRIDDVNGDGLDDVVQIRYDAIDLWVNDDGKGFFAKQTLGGTPKSPSFANRVRLVDVNGSGTRDVLWANGNRYEYLDLLGGTRPFLLNHVANGLGKTTDLEYGTSTAEMLAAARDGKPFETVIPTIVHVVKRVVESDNLDLLGAGPSRHVVEYSYRDPLWDGLQREFRGFASAVTRRIGDANSPTDLTESTFLLGECVDTAEECSLDNPRQALKGLPLVTERFDEQGVYLSTESVFYRLRSLYLGRDGRDVFHAFEAGRTTTLYDTHAGPASSATLVPTGAVLLEHEGAWGFSDTPPSFGQPTGEVITVSVPLRASSGYATLRSESVVDPFGNRRVAIDRGCIAGNACLFQDEPGLDAEEVLYSHTLPSRPAGDETSWLFRTVRSFVVGGSDLTAVRGDTTTEYNSKGNPTVVTAELDGTVPLWRSNLSPNESAPDPDTQSDDGTISLSSRTYDDFGNVITEQGPNGRCRKIGYDATHASGAEGFAQLPISETIYVDSPGSSAAPCTGNATLITTATYDRGLGKVVQVTDPNVQKTTVRYDGFGRLTHLRKPLPDGTIETSDKPWSVIISYDLATATCPYSVVTTDVQDNDEVVPASGISVSYLTTRAHVDGMGHTRYVRSEADTTSGDDAPWIDSELVTFDAKGAVARKYLPYFSTGALAPADFASVTYDAFGREVDTRDFGGVVTLHTDYHALSTDMWDAADREDTDPQTSGVQQGSHYGTYASVRKDGHGRVIATTERIKVEDVLQRREVRSRYLPTGEVKTITRVHVDSPTTAAVVRWMRYDSLGRMVLNVDPNTTIGFTDDADVTVTNSLQTYRYAYNDAGDMVGWSDARGCGVNYFYDRAGRLVAEDYSPCVQEHAATLPPYSPPDLTTLDGIEVYYQYDSIPTTFGALPEPADYSASYLKGRLAAVFDRASLTYLTYDARGRVTRTDRAIAHPNVLVTDLQDKYQAPWFTKYHLHDAMDRLRGETTGATSPELLGASQASLTTVTYSARGTVKRVSSTYGTLVTSIERSADGLIEKIVYGDAATTKSTQTYDQRRRLQSAEVSRLDPVPVWNAGLPEYDPPPATTGGSFQTYLRDETYEYDIVNNPIAINDFRPPADWPAGAKPVSRTIGYDDLYRVTSVSYAYGGGPDTWGSPFAAEMSGLDDPRRPDDFPAHLTLPTRVTEQTYEYDWLGSLTKSADDLNAFWDRGMGPMRNGVSNRPYQWKDAGTLADPEWDGSGSAQAADYDAAGNLEQIVVTRSGACSNGTNNCDLRFYYYFDEVGRLYRGTRYEGQTLKADLSFTYDSSDNRVIKTDNTLPGTVNDAHTLYVFDSLELRRTSHDATTFTYSRTAENEVPYLIANGVRVGRVVYEGASDGEPRILGNRQHVFLNIGDHLGSTSTVVDRATGELVERTTYQPYGATESDYRAPRWKGFREDYRFTGKEEDQEIGVTYFGKRFLSPYLGRWVTPDPLAVHSPGQADLNLYAYVTGAVLKSVDPFGLEPTKGEQIYRDWSQGWNDTQKSAASEKRTLEEKFRNQNNTAFTENKNRFDMGARDALGAGYQAAADRFDAATTALSQADRVHEWIRARVDAERGQVTEHQINEYAVALARSSATFQTYLAPLILGGVAARPPVPVRAVPSAAQEAAPKLLPAGKTVPNAGGRIISFVTQKQQTFYRVFSGDSTVGSFLTAVKPKSSAFAREALALPPGNDAAFVQEVVVPAGVRLQRSRALPAFGRRGGAEQFQLLEHIPVKNFGPGVPLE
jgi:RHS repeat-associated protein